MYIYTYLYMYINISIYLSSSISTSIYMYVYMYICIHIEASCTYPRCILQIELGLRCSERCSPQLKNNYGAVPRRADRVLYHSTLGSRVIKKKGEKIGHTRCRSATSAEAASACISHGNTYNLKFTINNHLTCSTQNDLC